MGICCDSAHISDHLRSRKNGTVGISQKRYGSGSRTCRALLHIFSTMALENGLDIKTLSVVLGHSSAETTISVYSHVTGEMERNAAKKMDDAFGTPKPADSPVNGENPDDGQNHPNRNLNQPNSPQKRARSASPARDVSPRFQRIPGRANTRPVARTANGNSISSTHQARSSASKSWQR